MARRKFDESWLEAGMRLKNGRIEYRFTHNGKSYSVSGEFSPAGIKACKEKAEIKKRMIDQGSYIKNTDITVKKYSEEWLKMKEGTIKPKTVSEYRKKLKIINEYIGSIKITELEKRNILDMRQQLLDTKYTSTVNAFMTVLKMMLRSAVDDQIIKASPAETLKSLKRTEPKAIETKHRALTDAELKIFFEFAEKESFLINLYKFLLYTGCRCGEACALTWQDIDYKAGVIHITKSVSADKDDKLMISNTPKNSSSVRDIPLTEGIKIILQSQKELIRATLGNMTPMQIFAGRRGAILPTGNVDTNINAMLKRINQPKEIIKPFTAHAFRDTYATNAVRAGAPLLTVAKLLGHRDLEMLSEIYAQVNIDDKRKAVELMTFAV